MVGDKIRLYLYTCCPGDSWCVDFAQRPAGFWYGMALVACGVVVVLAIVVGRYRLAAFDLLYTDKHPSPMPGPLMQRSAGRARFSWTASLRLDVFFGGK